MISTDTPPTLLSPDELAVRYQVTGATIRKWFREGKIPAEVAMGRVLRFDPEQVADALRSEAMEARKRISNFCEII